MNSVGSKYFVSFSLCAFSLVSLSATAQSGSPIPGASASSDRSTASTVESAADQDSNEGSGLEEIIVTAEKRSTNLERTPIAITVLQGETLERQQIRSLADVQSLVPSLQFGQQNAFAQITIRGIGTSNFVPAADAPVAVNLNEVYVSRSVAALAGLYDIADIEVLRGPQGTLYGRNATAGSVNMTTARPKDTLSGYGRVAVGNYGSVNVEGAISGPIIGDTLLVRLAAFTDQRNGYGKNLATGNDVDNKDAWGVRGTVVFEPTPAVKATLIGEYYKERDNGASLHYFGATGLLGLDGSTHSPPAFVQFGGFSAPDLHDVASGADSKFELQTSAITGILEWTGGPFAVKSISGYRDQTSGAFTPLDGGSTFNVFVMDREPADQFSEELQGHYDTSQLHLTAGLYYFKETASGNPYSVATNSNILYPLFGIPAPATPFFLDFVELGGTIKTTAKAAFTQGTYEIGGGVSVTGGIRYSEERKQLFSRNETDLTLSKIYDYDPANPFNGPVPPPTITFPPATFKSTTPKLGLQFQVTPETLVYASYAKGFKSGGFDITSTAPAFQPEKLTSYEVGLKSSAPDNRVRINVSSFYYDYSDLQVQQVVGFAVVTTNAATANVYGAEAEITAVPIEPLTLDAFVTNLHTRYRRYFGVDSARPALTGVDFSGNKLNNAPDWRAHLGAQYRWRLGSRSLVLRGEGDYSTRFYFTPANLAILSQPSFFKANAFLTYNTEQNWHVTAFVRNITDRTTKTNAGALAASLGEPAEGSVAPPRTFGMEVGYSF